jgi:hypothetical protein
MNRNSTLNASDCPEKTTQMQEKKHIQKRQRAIRPRRFFYCAPGIESFPQLA